MDDKKYSAELERLQLHTYNYFLHESNPANGLVIEKTAPDWPASVAATGLALSCYPIAVERGFTSREFAVDRILKTLRFFYTSRSGPEPEATGCHGFYYHLLDMNSGRRARMSELSVFDTSLLLTGAFQCAAYFNNDTSAESEIRELADSLYRKTDWLWMLGNGPALSPAWVPETGFRRSNVKGYDRSHIALLLGLGSPTFPLPAEVYSEWVSEFEWIKSYDQEYLYGGSLLNHQISHLYIDFRGIRDSYMRGRRTDYFGNSSKATRVQQLYAIDNTARFEGYGKNCWGITESDGPGPAIITVKGKERQFMNYAERAVPFGPDDGTVSPWAVISSLPFAPDIVLPAIRFFLNEPDLNIFNNYGFKSAFNQTYPHKPINPHGWRSPWHYALNQGPAMVMIENFRTGLLWELMKDNQYILRGLRKAGFSGGWLNRKSENIPAEANHLNK